MNLRDRRSRLLVEHIDALREATRKTKVAHPFHIEAFVVLPDHLHAVWTLPAGEMDFPLRWRLIKGYFSKSLPHREYRDAVRVKRGDRGIWQRRFWEHAIRNETDYRRHIDYCYINPVKHGHVTRVRDWPWSSFHRDVRQGLYPLDWAGDFGALEGTGYGEHL